MCELICNLQRHCTVSQYWLRCRSAYFTIISGQVVNCKKTLQVVCHHRRSGSSLIASYHCHFHIGCWQGKRDKVDVEFSLVSPLLPISDRLICNADTTFLSGKTAMTTNGFHSCPSVMTKGSPRTTLLRVAWRKRNAMGESRVGEWKPCVVSALKILRYTIMRILARPVFYTLLLETESMWRLTFVSVQKMHT